MNALETVRSVSSEDLYSAFQQYGMFMRTGNPEAGLQALSDARLSNSEWLSAADLIVNREPQLDARPLLRSLADQQPSEDQIWSLWITASSLIQRSEGWAAAVVWCREGLTYPAAFTGSLALRAGRILQSASIPRDYKAALTYYDQAIVSGGFLSAIDESNAYTYRGEVYRSLPNEYSSQQALAEFDRALEINPESYFGWIGKGNVFLFDLKEPDRAASFYRKALQLDDHSPHAYFYMGELASIKGELDVARQFYLKAQSLMPDWPPPKDRLKALEDTK